MNFHTGCPESSVKFSSALASWGQHSSEIKQAAHRTEELSSPWSRTRQPLPSVCGRDFGVACGGLLHLRPAPSESTSCISPFHSSPCHTSLCVLRTNKALLSVGLCSADYLHKLLTNRSWHGSFAPSCRAQPKCHLLGDLPLTQSLSYHVAWFSS